MARFTYRTVTWGQLADAMRADGTSPHDAAYFLQVEQERTDAWKGGEPLPPWFLVACAALPPYFTDARRELTLREFMSEKGWTSRTLARFTGVNPTTARRWVNGQGRRPYYLSGLIVLLAQPGALYRARAALRVLIIDDAEAGQIELPPSGTIGMIEAA